MADLKKLETAFTRVKDIQPAVEQMLADAGDNVLCKGSNVMLKDFVRAYDELCEALAGIILEKAASAQLEDAMLAAVKVAGEQAAAQSEIREGSLVITPTATKGDMNDVTVLVLEGIGQELLIKVIKGAAKYLAGGTNDVLAIIEKVSGSGGQYDAGYVYGKPKTYAGYPRIGTAVVTKIGSDKVQKSAQGPVTPEAPLAYLFEYLSKAALKSGRSAQINLVGPGLER